MTTSLNALIISASQARKEVYKEQQHLYYLEGHLDASEEALRTACLIHGLTEEDFETESELYDQSIKTVPYLTALSFMFYKSKSSLERFERNRSASERYNMCIYNVEQKILDSNLPDDMVQYITSFF